MCKFEGESINHVLVHCEVSSILCRNDLERPGCIGRSHSLLFLSNHIAFGKGKKAKVIWGCSVLAVIWML